MGLLLSGCVQWPLAGRGGMAEHRLEQTGPTLPSQPLGPEHGQFFELELARRHLDILILEGAELYFPATVVQATLLQTRIARQMAGGLHEDAGLDLQIQRRLLNALERQIDAINRSPQQPLQELPS